MPKFRSKGNHLVTIEAMRLPARDVSASEELVDFLDSEQLVTHVEYPDDGGEERIISVDLGTSPGIWAYAYPGDWVTKDANGFMSRLGNDAFESEWEPIDE